MIFNESVFKKLLKESYKGSGLLVGNKEGRIIIAGTWWVMSMEERIFSNKGRATLVELTGQLPLPGECWRSTGGGNQMEIPPDYVDIDKICHEVEFKEPFRRTVVTIERKYGGMARVYQRGKRVICINEIVETLLEPGGIIEGEDRDIIGPYTRGDSEEGMLYWYTNECSFAAGRVTMEEIEEYRKLLEAMEQLDIPTAKR